ncbi:hypothetical protein F4801DRAFT_281452 [Xylaria longipes]|nr:hypothetical protein F4801DRAFT_281452 [Xylaria longipes]
MDLIPRIRSYVGRSPHTRNEYLNACEEIHGESLWGRLVVPDHIVKVAPVLQPSNLLHMPLEILFQIMSLCTPVDAVCLALTCKALLGSCYSNIPLIPSMQKHSQLGYKCMGIFTLLTRTRPVDCRGKPTIYFMPCYACFNRDNGGGTEYWKGWQSPSSPPDGTEVLQPLTIRCPWCSARAEV